MCIHRKIKQLRTRKFVFMLSIITIVFLVNIMWYGQNELKRTPIKLCKSDLPEEVTLEGVHQKIWKQIQSLQEEGNCEEKKIMHCENIGNYAGLGSMVMRYSVCMQVAFALGRMFFIQQKEYNHFGGLSHFLKNESSRCGYIKDTYRSSNSVCNMHNPSCYLDNGYEIDNSYKVLEYTAKKTFPTPRRIPGTIPFEIEQQLVALNIEEPWLWFTSQFLGYLMLRLKPEMIKLMNLFKKDMNFTYPLISMHIRHGADKLQGESRYVDTETYLSVADDYFKTFLPNIKKRRVFIASDLHDILTSLKELRPNYEFLQLPREYISAYVPKTRKETPESLIYKRVNFPKEVLESIIIEIHLLLYGNYTICTHTSNVCRLIWALKESTPPYRIDNRLFSVDDMNNLDYFRWLGYTAPFNNYWTTMRSSINLTFSDGSKMMQYYPGMLFTIHGRRVLMVNYTVYYVVYIKTIYRFGGDQQGYVLRKDIVRWPGRPSYHFYN